MKIGIMQGASDLMKVMKAITLLDLMISGAKVMDITSKSVHGTISRGLFDYVLDENPGSRF